MSAALLTLATASLSVFVSHGFRSKAKGREKGWFCHDVEAALEGDVDGDRIVVPTDAGIYETSVTQYATSSLPPGALHPSAVVFAQSTEEVKKVVQYATTCQYRIAVRSGGHQYAGLSSCNSAEGKCIQLDVSQMDSFAVDSVGLITVGPGVSVDTLYTRLADVGMFFPAGECATVNMGGHGQTGGAGIFTRAFGFATDNIEGFEIVLAGGAVKKVTRPGWAANPLSMNDRLFYAVTGGAAGSWGVVTSYTLHGRKDSSYPEATYFQCLAEWTEEAYLRSARVFNEMVQDPSWVTDRAADESVFISITKREPIERNMIHVEGFWSGVSGAPFDDSNYQKFVAALEPVTKVTCSAMLSPPSRILTDNITWYAPREYPFPFLKTARAVANLDEDSIKIFAKNIDTMMANPGVYPVQQLASFTGQGNSWFNKGRSSLPHRDQKIILGLNAFYAEPFSPTAKADSQKFLDDTWQLLMETAPFKNNDKRIVWAPFDDLRIENTWQYFFDEETYLRLRAIKTMVDPTDVFRTQFTIPPLSRKC
ncbi:6-hydroxy-D-nicotine oxidase [Diplonema papillatum]|nr:6-hydroxy-D-nicotine oxidase [Diplonema papillatum]|eukprot:gene10546-16219_t